MNETFGDRLRLAMKLRNKKASDVVLNCGINKGNLSEYLSGKRQKPRLEMVETIANYLQVSPAYLLGFTDDITIYYREMAIKQKKETKTNEQLQRDALLNEIDAYCMSADLETLKMVRTLVKTICQK